MTGTCLVCGAGELKDQGPIFHDFPPLVAGVEINLPSDSFRLLACRNCGAKQKYPLIPEYELQRCYSESPADNWGAIVDPNARQIGLFESMLKRHLRNGRILDIGCSNGAILSHFGTIWEKYGIEPSAAASRVATERGISMLGGANKDAQRAGPFDAVMAIDIIEHISKPTSFFAEVRDILRTGGVFILFTGDTDAAPWSMFGSHHWYCSLPEHVVFLNEASVQWLAKHSRFQVAEIQRLAHLVAPLSTRANQMVRVAVWQLVRAMHGFGFVPLKRWGTSRRSPFWSTASDHMLIALIAV